LNSHRSLGDRSVLAADETMYSLKSHQSQALGQQHFGDLVLRILKLRTGSLFERRRRNDLAALTRHPSERLTLRGEDDVPNCSAHQHGSRLCA